MTDPEPKSPALERTRTLPRPLRRYLVGDVVFAGATILNDGGLPGVGEGELIAEAGARGVVARVGHAEQDPTQTVYAVRFEAMDGTLGPAVGCLPDELTQEDEVPE